MTPEELLRYFPMTAKLACALPSIDLRICRESVGPLGMALHLAKKALADHEHAASNAYKEAGQLICVLEYVLKKADEDKT